MHGFGFQIDLKIQSRTANWQNSTETVFLSNCKVHFWISVILQLFFSNFQVLLRRLKKLIFLSLTKKQSNYEHKELLCFFFLAQNNTRFFYDSLGQYYGYSPWLGGVKLTITELFQSNLSFANLTCPMFLITLCSYKVS